MFCDILGNVIEDIFEILELKAEEARTYQTLHETGPCPAGRLAKIMGAARPTLYGYLENLIAAGLVSQSLENGVKIFTAEPPARIMRLYTRKLGRLEKKKTAVETLVKALETRESGGVFRPRLKYYEGQDGVQNLLEDVLQYPGSRTYTMWPILAMREIIDPDFLHYHNVMRIRAGIYIRAIWQRDQALALGAPPDLGSGQDYLREIRLAPDHMKFEMGYWLYETKAAFISSRAESFAFLIESAELIKLLTGQHDALWSLSEPYEIHPKGENLFFEEVQEH